jgi:hypothetical protein
MNSGDENDLSDLSDLSKHIKEEEKIKDVENNITPTTDRSADEKSLEKKNDSEIDVHSLEEEKLRRVDSDEEIKPVKNIQEGDKKKNPKQKNKLPNRKPKKNKKKKKEKQAHYLLLHSFSNFLSSFDVV